MLSASDIKYFIETGKTQHISRAAERLGITQPALSHCIQKIEDSVGLRLFVRTKKGVTLTPAGKRLFDQAEVLLRQWDIVIKSVHDEVESVGGLIRLGCHSAVAQYTLPKFLPKLLHLYPDLKMQLHHGLSRHITEEVISSQIDVAIAVNPIRHPDLVIKEICKDVVTLWKTKSCMNEKLLLIDPNLLQTQDVLKKLDKRGLSFSQTLESSSLEVLCQLLQAGTGCAILPKRVVDAFSIEDLFAVDDAPCFHDRICLVFKPDFIKTKTGQTFCKAVTGAFS